jgi:hypothetical protein
MASGSATVTATYGPGKTATAQVISGIQTFTVNLAKNMIYFYLVDDDPTTPMREFALGNTMTFVATVSAGVWTITIVVS